MASSWSDVKSSAISAAKHDGRDMHIRYTSGNEYVHAGVPASVFEQFLNAPSHGKFFNSHIAKQYPGRS